MVDYLRSSCGSGPSLRQLPTPPRISRSTLHQVTQASIFVIPVLDEYLVYAPLHSLAALMDRRALALVVQGVCDHQTPTNQAVAEIVSALNSPSTLAPQPKAGPLAPAFLGLIPTRRCNLACRYCGFVAENEPQIDMDLTLAHDVVDWYLELVSQSQQPYAEIHYFGGEPFCAPDVLDLSVQQGRIWSEKTGLPIHFEAATNGVFSERRAEWAGDSLDTVVLSLDGFAELHDRHRVYASGQGSFAAVDRTARILSQSDANLFLRTCITADTVHQMPDIARWFCEQYYPQGVCFEPIQPTKDSSESSLDPPDPWDFATNFVHAAQILEKHGIETVYAAADINNVQVSFCPVGQDVVIVTPDGALSSCYLLQRDWAAKGCDLRLGQMGKNHIPEFDADAVAYSRSLNVWNKSFCDRCLCKWHCAGGCHVNHQLPDGSGAYDRLCIQSRIITICNILGTMNREDLMYRWLGDRTAVEMAVHQVSDLLVNVNSAV